jgi:PIN domain nuclease of toxin-antitoxin system
LNPANEIYLSAASIWEMAIKISLKKLSLTLELNRFVSQHVKGNDIRILTVKAQHTYPLVGLPFHHRDPFDRLLVSQCLSEKLSLISKDATFDKYPIKRIW